MCAMLLQIDSGKRERWRVKPWLDRKSKGNLKITD